MEDDLIPVEIKNPSPGLVFALQSGSVLAFALTLFGFLDIILFWKGQASKTENMLVTTSVFSLIAAQSILYSLRARAKLARQLADRYAKVVRSIGEDSFKDYKQARRFEELQEKAAFDYNLASEFCLTQFGCQQIAMYEAIEWQLQPNMNVLLGRNGYGKSHLIRSMLAILQRNEERVEEFFIDAKDSGSLSMSLLRNNEEETIICTRDGFQESIGKVPILAIPDARLIDQSNDALAQVNDKWNDLRQHSAYHFLFQRPYGSVINTFLYQVCIDYLADQRSGFHAPVFDLIAEVMYGLTRQRLVFHAIVPLGSAQFRMEVLTEAEANNPLPIQKVSQGTLSVVAMFGIIYYYLKAISPNTPASDVLQKKAVVVIDEIDAHLHPLWQRRIIGLLRKSFPNVQFIVTAHSPLVVGGCLKDEVSVLTRPEPTKGLGLHQFSHDFVGWEIEEIYREVFGVEGLDDVYTHFIALSPKQDEMKSRVKELEAKGDLNAPDDEALESLRNQLHYIRKVDQKQQDRVGYDDLRRENEMLKAENLKLTAQLIARPSEQLVTRP